MSALGHLIGRIDDKIELGPVGSVHYYCELHALSAWEKEDNAVILLLNLSPTFTPELNNNYFISSYDYYINPLSFALAGEDETSLGAEGSLCAPVVGHGGQGQTPAIVLTKAAPTTTINQTTYTNTLATTNEDGFSAGLFGFTLTASGDYHHSDTHTSSVTYSVNDCEVYDKSLLGETAANWLFKFPNRSVPINTADFSPVLTTVWSLTNWEKVGKISFEVGAKATSGAEYYTKNEVFHITFSPNPDKPKSWNLKGSMSPIDPSVITGATLHSG